MTVVAALLAGAVGAVLRALLVRLGRRGTLAVNLAGSLLLGLVAGATRAERLSAGWLLVVGGGLCGGLSTFSTYAVEVRRLPRSEGLLYAVLTLVACTALAALGLRATG